MQSLLAFSTTVDGHRVTFQFYERDRPRWIPARSNARWDRGHMSCSQTDYTKKPRLFVEVKGESLLDNLANRTTRPYNVWGKILRKAIAQTPELAGRIGWYNKAGCAMCPCSPGFIWSDAPLFMGSGGYLMRSYDVWAEISDVPTVRTDDDARLEQLHRLTQVAQDPTLPLDMMASMAI